MSILRGFLQTLGSGLFGLIAAMLGSVITARTLGPEGKGIVVVLGTLASTIVQFGSLGLTAANVHFTARGQKQVSKLAGISAWVSMVTGGGLGIAILLGVAWQPDLLPEVPWVLLLVTIFSLPFLLGSQLFQNLLLGMEAVGAYNWIEMLRTGLALSAILALFAFRLLNPASVVLLSAILAIGVFALTVRSVWARAALSWRFDAAMFRSALSYGLIFFVNNMLAFLLLKSDFFLVNHFLGMSGVGIYSVSVQIADLLLLAPATLGMLLFPRLSAIQDPIERTQTCLQFARLTAVGMATACFLTGIFSPVLIRFFFGAAFQPAWTPLSVLLPGIWLLALENVLIMHLAAGRLPIVVPGLWLLGLGVNVGLNLWLLPLLGLTAAALASTLAYALVAIGVLVLFVRETGASLGEALVPRHADLVKVVRHLRGHWDEGAPKALALGGAGMQECSGPEASQAKPLGPV
jgi:O-antigen/teichoic acid export membrane protein